MLHHISLPVNDLHRSGAMYDPALAALGYRRVCEGVHYVGYGVEDNKDQLLLTQREGASCAGPGFHLALSAPNRDAVDRFYAAAMQSGAEDYGKPGLRPHYGPSYYAAFIIDVDGHHIEAVINTD